MTMVNWLQLGLGFQDLLTQFETGSDICSKHFQTWQYLQLTQRPMGQPGKWRRMITSYQVVLDLPSSYFAKNIL